MPSKEVLEPHRGGVISDQHHVIVKIKTGLCVMNKTSFKLLDLNQWNSKHSSPAILKKNFVYSPESPSSGCGP